MSRQGSSHREGAFGFDRETAIGGAFADPAIEDRNPPRVVVSYFGSCTNPVRVASLLGRDVDLGVRCRKCAGCLRSRQFLWKLRAQAECFGSAQSYLFTGTYRAQYLDLEPVGESVTLWLKRLRYYIKAGSDFRYLVAFERHKSGAWHMHALLHDVKGTIPHLQHYSELAWNDGFTKCKPVDVRGAGYVTKYVSKDLDQVGETARRPRIRASRNPTYGAAVMERSEEIVKELQQRKVRIDQTYRCNLNDVMRWLDRRDDPWKIQANSQQMNGKLLLRSDDGMQQVDRQTGEILPYRKA